MVEKNDMTYRSPIGQLYLAFDGDVLKELRIEGCLSALTNPDSQSTQSNLITLNASPEAFRWLDNYFSGREPDFLPRLAPQGTAFQQRVWRELLTIPYGATVTYGELARRVGCSSAQAVGQAVGRNPIAIIIPCHRVVAAGGIGGYAYGTDLKCRLLALEFQDVSIE